MPNDIIPISVVSQPRSTTPTTTTGSSTLDKDAFLKLLVAQLKYQNPLSPTDPSQFMAQSAQFTMVEKLTSLEQSLNEQVVIDRNLSAASMIGRTIEWQDADGNRSSGAVTGTRLTADGPLLQVGDEQVSLRQVVAIS